MLNRRTTWVRFCVFFCLFILTPLTVAGFLFSYFFSIQKYSFEKREIDSLQKEMNHFLFEIDPQTYVLKRFRVFSRAFLSRKVKSGQLEKFYRTSAKKWGIEFKPYFFNRVGDLITPSSVLLPHRSLMETFWKAFSGQAGAFEKYNARLPKLKEAFGLDFTASMLRKNPFALSKIFGEGKEGFMFWQEDPYSKFGGIVLSLWRKPSRIEILSRLSFFLIKHRITLVVQSTDGKIHQTGSAWGTRETPKVIESFKKRGDPWLLLNDSIWISVRSGDLRIYAGRKRKPTFGETGKTTVNFCLLFLGMAGIFLSYRWIILKQDFFLSLRVKLFFLFTAILFLPLITLSFLSYKMLEDREQIMKREAIEFCRNELVAVDEGFVDEQNVLLQNFRKIRDSRDFQKNPPAFEAWVSRLIGLGQLSTVEFSDLAGEVNFAMGAIDYPESIKQLIKAIRIASIERFLQHRLSLSPNKRELNPFHLFVEAEGTGIPSIIANPDRIHPAIGGGRNDLFYWDFYKDPKHPAALISIAHNLVAAKDNYLRRTFRKRKKEKESLNLFAFLHAPPRRYSTVRFELEKLHKLSEKIQVTQTLMVEEMYLLKNSRETQRAQSARPRGMRDAKYGRKILRPSCIPKGGACPPLLKSYEEIYHRNQSFLAVGYPGKQLQNWTLLALYPKNEIENSLNSLKWKIFWGCLTTFLIVLSTGWVFSKTFLQPIVGFGKGIAAIKEQNTKFRLEVTQKDEFGDLAEAFNALMENLDELSAGKIVQDQLFPKGLLEVGNYRVFGVSKPAAKLGGDYFDYVSIGEKYLLVLIGDVTGHGVPAALIMALAKAIVNKFSRQGSSPVKLLEDLNRVIFDTAKKKRFMTLGLLWIDTHSNEAWYYNCGHPYPLFIRTESKSDFLPGKGVLLGRSAKVVVKAEPLTMLVNERILFYTDGVVESVTEAMGTSGMKDPYGHFKERVLSRSELPLQKACIDLIETHPLIVAGQEQPDDFTLVMVERRVKQL